MTIYNQNATGFLSRVSVDDLGTLQYRTWLLLPVVRSPFLS